MLLQTPNLPLGRLLTHTTPSEIAGPHPLKCLTQQEGIEFLAEEIAGVYLAGTEQEIKALDVSAGNMIVSAHCQDMYCEPSNAERHEDPINCAGEI